MESLKGEASLWQQEAQLYGRKAAAALSEATGAEEGQAEAAAADATRLDPQLAAALLAAPLAALKQASSSSSSSASAAGGEPGGCAGAAAAAPQLPRLEEEQYQWDYAVLLAQELPYFESAASCGHCGSEGGPEALADRAWFDFLSYIQAGAAADSQAPASLLLHQCSSLLLLYCQPAACCAPAAAAVAAVAAAAAAACWGPPSSSGTAP